jgi:F0F1-type ATP synthase epsilon subunit
MAVDADLIDEAKVEKARREAEVRLNQQLTDEEIAITEASLAHATTQLEVKRRRQVS